MSGRTVVWVCLLTTALIGSGYALSNSLVAVPPAASLPHPSKLGLDHSRPRPQGGFYRCPIGEPATCNPFTGMTAALRYYVLGFTHDPLLDLDPDDGSLRPALAATLPQIEETGDGIAFVFALRDGLTFSDGAPVTMEDVEYTALVAQQPGTSAGGIIDVLANAHFERIDTRRFRIVFDEFHFALESELGTRFRIVQRDWFEQSVAAAARRLRIDTPQLGTKAHARCVEQVRWPGPATGPYRFHDGATAWRPGVALLMTQNPRSWRREAYPDCWNLAGIQLLFDPSLSGKLVAALNNEVDYLVGSMDLASMLTGHPRLRANYRLESYQKLQEQTLCIAWNCREQPFDRADVRRALTMLFDREMLRDRLFQGAGYVPVSWFRRGAIECAPELAPLPFDPSEARRILAAAGVERVEILAASEFDPLRRVLALARSAFERAGVELVIRNKPWKIAQQELRAGTFVGGVGFLQTKSAVVDPAANFGTDRPQNHSGFHDAEFDRIASAAATERNREIRQQHFQSASRILHAAQPVTLLLTLGSRVLIHRRFSNAKPGLLGLYPERWWVEGVGSQ